MENFHKPFLVGVFVVLVIVVVVLFASFYYFNQIFLGKSITHTQAEVMRVVNIIAAIFIIIALVSIVFFGWDYSDTLYH